MRLLFAGVPDPVRAQLERYGLTRLVGADAYVPAVAVLQSVTSAVAGQAAAS